jgi:hypothetical protein
MKIFVVLDGIQKNIWELVKHQHVVLDIIDFLKTIDKMVHCNDLTNKKIIDKQEICENIKLKTFSCC